MARLEEDSYVNPVLKYTVFFCNFVFWLIGGGVLGIGIWAFLEKNIFSHDKIKTIADAIFDISILLIILGIIIFVLSMAGCTGALRENICLLKFFYYSLMVIFLLMLGGSTAAFVMRNKFKEKVTAVVTENLITKYTDDDDAKNVIDWLQEKLQCCGISSKGYKDWNQNRYFNCSNTSPTDSHPTVQCSVPYSCCKNPDDITKTLKNIKCGAGVLSLPESKASKKINTEGCIPVAQSYLQSHVLVIAGVLLAFATLMLSAIFLVRNLSNQILMQSSRAEMMAMGQGQGY
ncbi:tetraspanin-5-like isoform X1 [Argonauta hians]